MERGWRIGCGWRGSEGSRRSLVPRKNESNKECNSEEVNGDDSCSSPTSVGVGEWKSSGEPEEDPWVRLTALAALGMTGPTSVDAMDHQSLFRGGIYRKFYQVRGI